MIVRNIVYIILLSSPMACYFQLLFAQACFEIMCLCACYCATNCADFSVLAVRICKSSACIHGSVNKSNVFVMELNV